MPRNRLYIAGRYSNGSRVKLDEDRARYLGRVLRLRAGSKLSVFDGEGREFAAEIERIGKSTATLIIGKPTSHAAESPLRVHLVQGISRGERMDFVVQKATELGVKRITPVLTDYGVVKLDAERASKRRNHWEKVAASACEQCGRARLPLVDTPLPLMNWFGARPESVDREIILRPGSKAALLDGERPATKVCLLIGPEGGFSAGEYENAEVAGFIPASLGARILRTETAAVAALALLQSRWGDLG